MPDIISAISCRRSSPELNKQKVICMALLHDFGEIYAGDFTPLDKVEAVEKQRLERQSVQQVLSKLPSSSTDWALREEYEAGISPEAHFVRQIDRLKMGLQASVYSHQGLKGKEKLFRLC
ncbi:MAG: HD domain-containing protein [Rhizonema sp. PD38]|nr:HD domain-containing protein [Rhizonema sp. PD38]